MKLLRSGFIFVLAAISSCKASVPVIDKATANLPCYDGWQGQTVDGPRSFVFQPSESMIFMVNPQIAPDRKFGCWHQLPDGDILVLSADKQGNEWSTTFKWEAKRLVRKYES